MILTNDKIAQNSIVQSSYNYFCECLKDFKEIQPDFEYTVNFGTNSMNDFVEDEDKFNFVVYAGVPDLIPSHWVEIDGDTDILYAGFINLAVSFINPIPAKYTNDLVMERIDQEQYIDSTYYQEDFNEVSDETNEKIEFGMRILEAFSRFMRRKGVKVDNFNITSMCQVPIMDGLFDNGFYRFLGTLDIQLKFNALTTLGGKLVNGEETRVWIKTAGGKYQEIYNIFDFEPAYSTVDKTYPLFDKTTTITTANQLNRSCSVNFPELDIGGSKLIKRVFELGNLDEINNMYLVYYDGKVYKKLSVVPTNITNPYQLDKFNGITVVFAVKSEVEEVDGSEIYG